MKKYASKFLAIVSLMSLFLQSAYPVILAYENTDAGSGTSCTLSTDRTSVTQGESVTFTLTSGYGYSAYWGGSNNDQPIGGNYPLDGFSGIEAANNWQGTYRQDTTGIFSRYVEILNEEGNVICTTNTVSVSIEPQSESPTPDPWDDYSGGINLGQTQDPDTPPEPITSFETLNTHYEGESCEPYVSCSTSVPNAEDSSKPLYCRSIDQDNYQWVTQDYANSRCNENNINLTAVCNEQTFYCNGITWSSQPISTITEPTPSSQTFPSPSPELIPEPTAEPPTALSIPIVTDPTSQATAQEVGEGLAMSYARERMQSFAIDRQQTEGGSQNNLAYTLDQTTETAGNAISTATGVVENTAGQINSTIQNFGIGSPSQPPSNITCTLTAEPQSIEAGSQVRYTIDSSAYGYSAVWKGSENGQPIDYQVEDFSNTNYWTKTYTHNTPGTLNYSVQILNDAGKTLCTTNPVEIRITERTAQQPEDSLKEQQTLDRFNEANKHLGITVSGNLNNPIFSVQTTSPYATTATSGTQFLFDSSKEEQKKFFTESKKRVDSTVFTTADFFLAGIPDILINKAGDIVDQYSLTTAVCQKAGVDVLFDPSYREQITGSIKLKGRTGLDFKQWQDFAKAVNPSSSNPFPEEQIEQGRQKAYELIKKRLDSTSFAYQSKLNEVNGMNEEQAKQGCSQAFGEFIANQKELENELQSVEIMLLAGGPINAAQEAGLNAAKPVVKKVTNPIFDVAKKAWNSTIGRIWGGREADQIEVDARYITSPSRAGGSNIIMEAGIGWVDIRPEIRNQALEIARRLDENVNGKTLLSIAQQLQSGLSEKDIAEGYGIAQGFINKLKAMFVTGSGKISPARAFEELNQESPGLMMGLAYENGIDGQTLVSSLANTEPSRLRSVLETLFPAIFTTAANRPANFQKIAPALADTIEAFSKLRFFCLQYLPTFGPSFCDKSPKELFDVKKMHIISQEAMDRLCGKGADGCAAGDRVYVVGRYLDIQYPSTNTITTGGNITIHECVHKYCTLMNRDVYWATQFLFPEKASNIKGMDIGQQLVFQPARFLYEGLTEYTTQQALSLTGNVSSVAYPNAVMFVDQQIIPLIMKNSSRSRDEAIAVVVEAALGNFDNLYAEVGGGSRETGINLLREILPNVAQKYAVANPEEAIALIKRQELIRKLFLAGAGGSLLIGAGAAANSIFSNDTSQDQNLPSQPKPGSLLPSSLVSEVNAQEKTTNDTRIVSLNKYEYLAKQETIKRLLTSNQSIDSLTLTDIMNQEFVQPTVDKTSTGYMFTSDRTGVVRGEVEKGSYLVGIKPIPGFDIKVPEIIEVKEKETTIPISIKKGTGKVEKITAPKGWQQFLKKLLTTVSAQEKKESQVQMVVFSDTNNNGKIDKNEQVLPWAGLTVELKRVNQDRTIALNPGWNLVALEVLPAKPLNASTFLQEIAKQGGYATTLSALENGAWKSFVVRGDKTYSGEDFPVTAGKAYFVKALKPSVLVYQGQELVAPIKLNLASGWNGVGVPYSEKPYQAADFIDTLNTKEAGSDTASRWESGLWDTFVKLQDQRYGENFMIEQGRGYLLKVAKGLEFSP